MRNGEIDEKKKSAGVRRGVKGLALFAALGWIVAGLLIADTMYGQNMTTSLQGALVRSQTERHELSKELERKANEIKVLEKRLLRYQSQETRAAANP